MCVGGRQDIVVRNAVYCFSKLISISCSSVIGDRRAIALGDGKLQRYFLVEASQKHMNDR